MEIPVINLEGLEDEVRRSSTTDVAMARFRQVCSKGFFWVENHGVDAALMHDVKQLVTSHYDEFLKTSFYESQLAKGLGPQTNPSEVDWEVTYFVHHQPESDIDSVPDVPTQYREAMEAYIGQLIKVAERLAELVSMSLGLDKDHLRKAFAPPFVGTKVAVYPRCPRPELVMGLRGHSDAGGIILLLQDDTVPGLEFFGDVEWVPVTPHKGSRIFVNFGDQVEVLSNGAYKSVWHRVRPNDSGSRLSIATFYNPGADAVISPASKLLYPGGYRFQDYLNYYLGTKFSDKVARLQAMKEMPNSTGNV